MATDAENLATIRSNLISVMVTESAAPKPSYSIDGQSVSWTEYRTSLLSQIKQIDELTASTSGPWEVSVTGIP